MVNKVTLIGRLGKDPEKRALPSGAVYVRFSLATNESYKDKEGNWQDQTEWHNIIMWREMAERAERNLKKGMLVYIGGKLTHRSWQDQDGKTNNMTEIAANIFRTLEKREGSGGSYSPLPEPEEASTGYSKDNKDSNESSPVDTGGDNDDLPF